MLKYCLEKWNKNRDRLENSLRTLPNLYELNYHALLQFVVADILNDDDEYDLKWDYEHITEIDNGDYQGTLLYLIPEETYQPNEYEYLMTYIGYGSCSGCDTLEHIRMGFYYDKEPSDEVINEYMALCKDFVTNMIKPYNCGWREDDRFEVVTMGDEGTV